MSRARTTLNAKLLAKHDLHTPPDQLHQLESLSTEREHLKRTLEAYRERREAVYEKLGCPNRRDLRRWRGRERQHRHTALLREYFDIGDRMQEITRRLSEITSELKRRSDTTLPSMFVDVARQLLPPEEFERIMRYTRYRLNEIHDQVD